MSDWRWVLRLAHAIGGELSEHPSPHGMISHGRMVGAPAHGLYGSAIRIGNVLYMFENTLVTKPCHLGPRRLMLTVQSLWVVLDQARILIPGVEAWA